MKMMLKKKNKADRDIERYHENEDRPDGESIEEYAEEAAEYCESGESDEEDRGLDDPDSAFYEAEEGYEGEEEYCEAEEGYEGEAEYYEAEEGYEGEAEYYEAEEGYEGEEEYCEAVEGYEGEAEYCEAGESYEGEAEYCEADNAADGSEEYYEADSEGGVYDTAEVDNSYYGTEAPEGYYGEEALDYDSEITYEETPWELKSASSRKRIQQRSGAQAGFFANFGRRIRSMDIMDRIMLMTGVGVLILAIVTGGVFMSNHMVKQQVLDFANVGRQLEGIGLIGEYGLLAVADAEIARLAAASAVSNEEQKPEYQESGYENQVTVEMNFTSIQRDLKIKFTNKRTGKLVPNVPFAVTVTAPDGSTSIWSDDDMDGIIYKTDIAAGTYKVAMEKLTDSRYADYTISTDVYSATVEKEIVYKKVDVTNEVKQESEVNAAAEDTKIKETTESTLKDTVTWVESKAVPASYDEVLKGSGDNDIPDPLSLMSLQALNKTFLRMTEGGGSAETDGTSEAPTASEPADTEEPTGTEEPSAEPTQEPTGTEEPSAEPTQEPTGTEEPSAEPTQEPTGTEEPSAEPTQEPTGTETPSPEPTESDTPATTEPPSPSPSPVPSPSPAPVTIKVTVNPTTLSGTVENTMTAQATVEATADGKVIENFQYNITASSDNTAVAAVTVDSASGKISVKGVKEGTAKITVKVEQAAEGEGTANVTPATATIDVTITGPRTMTLNQTSMTVTTVLTNQDVSGSLVATVTGVDNPEVKAVSSDPSVATVNYQGNVVNILGIKAGSAVITVTYTEGDAAPVTATCTVTVKTHPQNDTSTKLQTKNGQQVYVQDGNEYREAVWADYYVDGRTFYVRKEIKYTGWQTLDGKVYFYTADGIRVTGEQVIQGAAYTFASDGSLLVGSNGTVGIDVSKWNGTIDWNAVKNSGISYVIIRCGYRGSAEGKLIEDPKFEANIKGATAAGLKVGIYFFSQAVNEVEAVEEASMVLGLIKGYTISYPVFLDVEASGGRGDKIDKSTRTAVCNAFCQTIKNEGYTAGVYSNKTWLESKIDTSSLGAYKIWLAQYAEKPTYTGRYEIWQYRDSGKVSGISGDVDMNISYLGY